MRVLAAALLAVVAQAASQTLPPPYPRGGTTKLIDNERVLVWDVSWPKGDPPLMHRHRYDMTGIYYWPGDRAITTPDGQKRPSHTDAGRIQWLRAGVVHAEEGTSDDSLRAVMIELKGDKPSGKRENLGDAPPFALTTMPLLDNERVTVSDYTPPPGGPKEHRHPLDAVVVATREKTARATFIPAGTVHGSDEIAAGMKTTVFELK